MTLPTLPTLARDTGQPPLPPPYRGQGGCRSEEVTLPREQGKVRPCTLYRFWNADGHLLYVGITFTPGERFSQHRYEKPWWSEITTITLEHYPSRDAALAAEADAIKTEHPAWNVTHNDRSGFPYTPARLAVESTRPWAADDMPDRCPECTRYTTPHTWDQGRAYYRCEEGHAWWCEYSHGETGRAT